MLNLKIYILVKGKIEQILPKFREKKILALIDTK